jgi:hypothetical protein
MLRSIHLPGDRHEHARVELTRTSDTCTYCDFCPCDPDVYATPAERAWRHIEHCSALIRICSDHPASLLDVLGMLPAGSDANATKLIPFLLDPAAGLPRGSPAVTDCVVVAATFLISTGTAIRGAPMLASCAHPLFISAFGRLRPMLRARLISDFFYLFSFCSLRARSGVIIADGFGELNKGSARVDAVTHLQLATCLNCRILIPCRASRLAERFCCCS